MTLGIVHFGCSLHAPNTAQWLLMEHTFKLSLVATEAKEGIQVWSSTGESIASSISSGCEVQD